MESSGSTRMSMAVRPVLAQIPLGLDERVAQSLLAVRIDA
jgi:hypothetical protein